MDTGRVHHIDWLRVLAVLLLFPFHSARVFNAWEPFYSKSATTSVGLAFMIGFIDRWHMPLLFLLAGASTYLAMRRRSIGRYAAERCLRLLVPLVFGVFALVPPQTWFGARTNDGYLGSFTDYIVSGRFLAVDNLFGRGDYFGGISPAHLWFILFLWMISMLVLPLLWYGRSERGSAALARVASLVARPGWWVLVMGLLLLAEAMPEIGGKNLVFYLAYFVLGYVVMHDGRFAETAERLRLPALLIGSAVNALTLVFFRVGDSLPDPSAGRAAWTFAVLGSGWLIIVGLLGYGRRWLERPSPGLAYLSEASYPVYILHQTVIVGLGFHVAAAVSSPWLGWVTLMALAVPVTFGLYEVVRRTGPLRFLFGMKAARG